jgi:glucose/arabinose dehydrogenase
MAGGLFCVLQEVPSMSRHKLHILAFGALAAAAFLPQTISAQTCTEPAGTQFRTDTLVAPTVAGTGTVTCPDSLSKNRLCETGAYGAVGMALAPDGKIFIAMMKTGQIKVYDPAIPGVAKKAGTVPTWASTEDGMLGVAVDPNYMTNKWIYTFASDPCGLNCANRAMELARFTYNDALDTNARLTNKKIILRFPRATNDDHHAAGNMSFDANGVLVIGTGDNRDPHNSNNNGFGPIYYPTPQADAQGSSANTNDLRGKVLRIKPIAFADNTTPAAGVGTTYTIPAGNLWEKINNTTYNPGWRNDSDDITKVRQEIYTMGLRNPFHPRVDSRSGWIFWGEIGPDQGNQDLAGRGPTGHDEWNLATSAGFFGHPYCNGYNVPYASLTSPSTAYGAQYDCNATGNASLMPMVNKSPNNTGIRHLPASVRAMAAYASGNSTDDDPRFSSTYSLTNISHGSESSIGSQMYRYDPNLASTVKFPPYYEGKTFFFDWARRNFRVITVDSNGTIPAGAAGVTNFAPTGWWQSSYLDMQFGPDGALYALRNSRDGYSGGDGGLFRVRYTGTYDNSCYQTFNVKSSLLGPGATQGSVSIAPSVKKTAAAFIANGYLTLPAGYKTVELYDLTGRMVWSHRRVESATAERIKVPVNLGQNVLQARLVPYRQERKEAPSRKRRGFLLTSPLPKMAVYCLFA